MIRRWSRRRKGRIRIVLGVMQHEKREQQNAFPSQPFGGLFPQRELHTLCLHPHARRNSKKAAPTSARERPFRTSFPACFRRSRAASAPMSASGRPCGAAPDDAAAPAGHVPLPACELNNLLPERPAAAAEGWWPALRGALPPPDGPLRPPSATDSGSKTGFVRRLLLPGRARRAPCAHTAPGGTGCVADPVCGARRRRREVPLALVEGRRALPAPARIAHRSDARASCIPPHTSQSEIRGKATAAFLHRFVESLPQKRPTDSRSFFFSAARSVVIMAARKSRDFLFLEFQWFIIEPNRYKMAAGSPKTRVDPPYGVFLFSPSRLRRRTEK